MALKLTEIDDYFEKEETAAEEKPKESLSEETKFDNNDDIDDDVFITPASKKRKRRMKFIFFGILALVIVAVVAKTFLWGQIAEEGKVRCYVVSMEKRGTVFESYECVAIEEGTLEQRLFSTRNIEIGKRIFNALGTDSLFVIEYTRYRTSLPWRGETTFVVKDAQTAPSHPLKKPESQEKQKSKRNKK